MKHGDCGQIAMAGNPSSTARNVTAEAAMRSDYMRGSQEDPVQAVAGVYALLYGPE